MKKSKLEIIFESIVEIKKMDYNHLKDHPIQGRIRAVGYSISLILVSWLVGFSILLVTLKYTAPEIITIIEAVK